MLEDHLEPGDRLARRLAFVVPDRRQRGPDVVLVKVLDRQPSELGQHVKGERREPAARLAVALELRLARVEAFVCDVRQRWPLGGRLTPQPLAFADRIEARGRDLAPTLGLGARLLQ